MANNCKYYKEEEYRSLDGGITWTAMGVYRKGDLLEYDSPDCGTPTPTGNTKFSASYSGGETYSAACDGDTTLTSGNTRPSGYVYSAMTSAEIGSCITSIGYYAFGSCRSLTSVTIPDSVTIINERAFQGCDSLTSIMIPDSVTSIGMSAFINCYKLKSVTIGNGVTSIGIYAFRYCTSLTSVTIGSGVTSIGGYAFEGCRSLRSIDIPSGVTSIGASAFYRCSGLTSVTVEATTPPTLGNNAFYNTNNCPIYVPCASVDTYKAATNWSTYADRIQGIPPCSEPAPTFDGKFKATYTGGTTYSAACDSSTILTSDTTKPSGYNYSAMTTAQIGQCVTSIASEALSNCRSLTNVNIPNSVTSISSFAFDWSSLKNVVIPNSVTYIGDMAFWYCTKLSGVTIPNSVTYIGIDAFDGTPWYSTFSANTSNHYNGIIYINDIAYELLNSGITSITFKDGTTGIGGNAFSGCTSLTSVTIPNLVEYIGDFVFAGCSSLTSIGPVGSGASVKISSGVKTIGNNAFYNCTNITSIELPNTLTTIGLYAFNSCSGLTNVTIGSGVTSIDEGAFINCARLAVVDIPSGVTYIGSVAFWGCSGLTSCTIGSGVTSIGNRAFRYCSGLTSCTINAQQPPTLGSDVFQDTNNCPIYVPDVDVYKQANGWSRYADRIQPIT